MERHSLSFPARLESLSPVADFIQQVCRSVKSPELTGDFVRNVGLVVSEAVTNAIRHGSRDEEDLLAIFIDVTDDGMTIRVRDHGPGFDLNSVALPDLEQAAEGGYGIYIIRTLMDNVRYVIADNGNELVMRTLFSSSDKRCG